MREFRARTWFYYEHMQEIRKNVHLLSSPNLHKKKSGSLFCSFLSCDSTVSKQSPESGVTSLVFPVGCFPFSPAIIFFQCLLKEHNEQIEMMMVEREVCGVSCFFSLLSPCVCVGFHSLVVLWGGGILPRLRFGAPSCYCVWRTTMNSLWKPCKQSAISLRYFRW